MIVLKRRRICIVAGCLFVTLTVVIWPLFSSLLSCRPARSGPPHPQVVFSVAGRPALVLFSARSDFKQSSVVLIGYFDYRVSPKLPAVLCRLIMQTSLGSKSSLWKVASVYAMREGYLGPYGGVAYSCPVEEQYLKTKNYHVEVVGIHFNRTDYGITEMPVQFADATNVSSKAAACVPPLRYAPDEEPEARLIMRLVEFIEVNRLLGVDHFFFYNLSLPSNASKVLQHYESIGWASVTQWSLAPGVHLEKESQRYSPMIAINDCLYAVRDRYRLVASLDIDEFLVPTDGKGKAISLEEAAKQHDLRDHGGYCALAFRNGVFPPLAEFESDGFKISAESGVGSKRYPAEQKIPALLNACRVANLLRNRRIKAVPPFPHRTKMLAVARQIEEMNAHYAFSTWHCRTRRLDPSSEGLLHHFRRWPAGEMIEDVSMQPLRRDIETAVSRARERLKHVLNVEICA